MNEFLPFLIILPATILVAMICFPNKIVNTRPRLTRRFVSLISGIQFFVALILAIAHVAGIIPTVRATPIQAATDWPIALTVYYDGIASLMLVLVSFVGWVICRYSIRYLDGESTQGRYFRWSAFTIGSVSLMVVSGNLLMFVAAWVMTSLGLHQLLLHYGHRPAAQRAAWTKFTISRLGDAALIVAMVILYWEFKTLDFSELFAAADAQAGSATAGMNVAALLLIAGAITKSAQFPFHTWLPQTMETPTPVSALMHAGIVNAGGYLIIRTSPLVSLNPWALSMLALIGAVTACFAAIVMLTQTNVKKTLAYSTIAQMGFMMLQCGLGAYSAAMLHILAHSLYKAHAFLSSGSVMTQRSGLVGGREATGSVSLAKLSAVAAANVTLLGISLSLMGVDPVSKPGGLLLGGVLCLALTQWIGQVLRSGSERLAVRAFAIAACLCLVYSASFVVVETIVASSLPQATAPASVGLIGSIVLFAFAGMFVLQWSLDSSQRPQWITACYVHASNGFYIESGVRRVFGPLARI